MMTIELQKKLEKVEVRYSALSIALHERYEEYFNYICTAEDMLVLNAWHAKLDRYLRQRRVRELLKCITEEE